MSLLPISFLNPWLLSGFLLLPALWWLLRILPPPPRKITLPTARFLRDLKAGPSVTRKTSIWILVLRMLIFSCLILSFAKPVWKQDDVIVATTPLRIVFDDGWSAAQTWDLQLAKAEEILARSGNRPVQFLPTSATGEAGFISAGDARGLLKKLQPQPYSANIDKFCADIKGEAETIWLSSGLEEIGVQACLEKLSRVGPTKIYLPAAAETPVLLRGPKKDNDAISNIELADNIVNRILTLQIFGERKHLTRELKSEIQYQRGGTPIEAGALDRGNVSEMRLKEISGAGGVYLNGTMRGNSTIGIAISGGQDSSETTFSPAYYLTRAVQPFAKPVENSIDEIIRQNPGTIILPDVTGFSKTTENKMRDWIANGGILLRFAGPRMAENENSLVSLPLLLGQRAVSGDLSGTAALKLSSFAANSPLAGMPIPDITVDRQILPAAGKDNDRYIWARLSDQTPLISAKPLGRGLIILVHTTATPDWSDFILSGFVVDFLKEISELSKVEDKSKPAQQELKPYMMLDGWGNLQTAEPGESLRKEDLPNITPSAKFPPGLYGDANRNYALNLGDNLPELQRMTSVPHGVEKAELLAHGTSIKLDQIFLLLAIFLFLLDWAVILILSAISFRNIVVILFCLFMSQPAFAGTEAAETENAAHIHLACIASGDRSEDQTCRNGLENLSRILKERTAADIAEAVIVEPDKDELAFYPLLYWPIDAQAPDISDTARQNLQNYINHGGIIFIDTKDGSYASDQIVPSANIARARKILSGLQLPALAPATTAHVIFRSFYLLNGSAYYNSIGKIWVDADTVPQKDGTVDKISTIFLSGGDWATQWATGSDETAQRFGVNLVLYALTGNYKADQIHMQTILQRMQP